MAKPPAAGDNKQPFSEQDRLLLLEQNFYLMEQNRQLVCHNGQLIATNQELVQLLSHQLSGGGDTLRLSQMSLSAGAPLRNPDPTVGAPREVFVFNGAARQGDNSNTSNNNNNNNASDTLPAILGTQRDGSSAGFVFNLGQQQQQQKSQKRQPQQRQKQQPPPPQLQKEQQPPKKQQQKQEISAGEKEKPALAFTWSGAGALVFGGGDAGKTGPSTSDATTPEDHHDPHFEPVIALPDLVALPSGEEDETALFCQRARLFRWTEGQWKERGVGQIKLLRCLDGRCRLVMRRDQVHKICCNHRLTENLKFNPMPNSDSSVCWYCVDFSEETAPEGQPEQFAIKFKTKIELAEFLKVCADVFQSAPVIGPGKGNTQDSSKPTA